MENEEVSLINALNPGDAGFVAGRPPLSPLPLLHTPEIGPRRAQPQSCLMKELSPLEDLEGHTIQPGSFPIWSRTIPFEAILYRQNKPGKPACWLLLCSIVHFRFTGWKKSIPSYREILKKYQVNNNLKNGRCYHLHFCHSPSTLGRRIQAFLNTLLMAGKMMVVIDQPKEETHGLHQQNPNGILPQPSWGSFLDRVQLGPEQWGPSISRTLQKAHIRRT